MKRKTPVNSTEEPAEHSALDRVIYIDLLATVMLSVLAFGTVEPWSIAIFEINALSIAVLLALKFVVEPHFNWKRLRIVLPILALICFGIIQMIPTGSVAPTGSFEIVQLDNIVSRSLSYDRHATREATVKLFALAIYFIAALMTLRNSKRRKSVLILLTAFGFIVSVFAIVQRLTYNGKMYWVRQVSDYIAPYGPFGNYNHFAGFIELILPLPFAYLLVAEINIEQRLLWLFSVVIMAVALISSLSRGGILAMSTEILLLLMVAAFGQKLFGRDEKSSNSRSWGTLLTIFAAVALIALWISYESLIQRFNLIRQGSGEFSVVTRIEYWGASWKMFLDHPVGGVGLGAFPAVYPGYGRSTAKYERLEQTHNDYLQLLTDAGIIGAALGIWFLFEVVRVARRQFQKLKLGRGRSQAIIIGGYTAVIGMLVHSFTDFNLQIASNALLFLFVLALTTSAGTLGTAARSRTQDYL